MDSRPARMALRPYSSRPLRAAVQLACDLLVLAWVVVWILIGRYVDRLVHAAARSGYALQSGAGGVAVHLRAAGHGVAQVPLLGHPLSAPLSSAGGAAGNVADAGRALGDRIAAAALPAGLLVALVPILPVLLTWFPLRLRFARRAGACAELARLPGGDALLALRALATRSPRRLTAISADPVAAWRAEDPQVVRRLADLELRHSGARARWRAGARQPIGAGRTARTGPG